MPASYTAHLAHLPLTCTGHNDVVTSRMLLHSRTSCQLAHMQSSTPAWPQRQGVELPSDCKVLPPALATGLSLPRGNL